MKKYIFLLILFLFFIKCNAQGRGKSSDIGIFAGGSYYIGDINTAKQFYLMNPTFGIFLRRNFNPRYSLRAGIYAGSIGAHDADSKYLYQKMRNYSFYTSLIDFSVLGEFNFIPYMIGDDKKIFSPYTFVGFTFLKAETYHLAIPLGFGFKFNVAKRIGIELEWGFRRAFTDLIDNTTGIDIPNRSVQHNSFNSKQTGYYHSNDWYSFVGINLIYKFFEERGNCKAYY